MSTILLIDDDPRMLTMIQRILQSENYQVATAASGVLGLELFRQLKPKLVITDILMPDKDGIETLRKSAISIPTPGSSPSPAADAPSTGTSSRSRRSSGRPKCWKSRSAANNC